MIERRTRLKELRNAKGVPQSAVAAAIYCSPNAYALYEGGEREPSILTLKRLSKYFGVSIDCIVCND